MGFFDAGAQLAAAKFNYDAQIQTNKMNYKIAQENNKANRELAAYQYEQNLAQWYRENEYNSPSAQMKRLESAGINPNMAFASGSVSNTSASSPQYEAPTMQGARMDAPTIAFNAKLDPLGTAARMLSMSQDFRLYNTRIDRANLENELLKEQIENTRNQSFLNLYKGTSEIYKSQEILNRSLFTEWKRKFEQKYASMLANKRLELLTSQIGLNASRGLNLAYDSEYKAMNNNFIREFGLPIGSDGLRPLLSAQRLGASSTFLNYMGALAPVFNFIQGIAKYVKF